MKTRSRESAVPGHRPAGAGRERSYAALQLMQFASTPCPAQRKLEQSANQWELSNPIAQLRGNSRQKSVQMKMGEDRLAANPSDRRHAATHVSEENREEKEEEKTRQSRMANAWQVTGATFAKKDK